MTYLPFWIHFFSILTLLIFLFVDFLFFLFLVLIYAIVLYFFRRKKSIFKETPSVTTKGLIFSPVSGRLSFREEIESDIFGERQKVQVLGVRIFWWNETGIYMPMSSEIGNINFKKGEDILRLSSGKKILNKKKTLRTFSMSLKGSQNQVCAIDFLKCPFGLRPTLWAMPGDRGRRQAPMGVFPLGGSVLIYLPEGYKMISNIGDSLNSGESVLAAAPSNEA